MIFLLFQMSSADVIVPTIEGLEYTFNDNKLHYSMAENKLDYEMPTNRLHYSETD